MVDFLTGIIAIALSFVSGITLVGVILAWVVYFKKIRYRYITLTGLVNIEAVVSLPNLPISLS